MLIFDTISRVSDEELLKARALHIRQLLRKLLWCKIIIGLLSGAVLSLLILFLYFLMELRGLINWTDIL
jgi:hypothetical protein